MNKQKLKSLLENFSDKSVLVIGDMMMDKYIWGSVERISPEAPVPVVTAKDVTFRPGGAANVVNNISSLSGKVYAAGVIGHDEMGKKLLVEFKENNLPTEGLMIDSTRPTICKTRVLAHNQQIVRIDHENVQKISDEMAHKILHYIQGVIEHTDTVLVSDYNKGLITSKIAREVIILAKEKEKKIIVDPKPVNIFLFTGATVVVPNYSEVKSVLAPAISDSMSIKDIGLSLLEKLQTQAILITLGKQGMLLIEKNRNVFELPASTREVYDVSGAGDTVVATLSLALAAGASMIEATELANQAAGIVVTKLGTATVKREEIEKTL